MVPFEFSINVRTASYGTVTAGQVVDVTGDDAERYERSRWGRVVPPASADTPKPARKRRTTRQGD